MGKGQSSVELMILLAASLIVLIAIVSYSNESIAGINKEKQLKTAENSVNEIVNAANDVFFQGAGARKKVFYEVPSGIDETTSGIENRSVVLNVLESDIYAMAKVQLSGSLPVSQGGHWIWVEAKEGYVSIGAENITVDKTSIYTTMEQDSNAQKTITITNNAGSAAAISIVQTWSHANVTFALSSTSFSLDAGNNKTIDLNFNASSGASGNYSGQLQINASFSGGDQNIIVPITAEVTTLGQSASNLAIFPSSYSVSVAASDTDTNSFQTCNLIAGTMSGISFSSSIGDAGDWVESIATISSLAASKCSGTSFTIMVPGGTVASTYTGTITASNGTYQDSIALSVTVTNQSDAFAFSWLPAEFADNGKDVVDWNISNTSGNASTIARIKISGWSANDLDGAKLFRIKLDNDTVWNDGGGQDGDWIDIDDFEIAAYTSYSNNNKIEFDDDIDDEGETFTIQFEFGDGSVYTTAIWPVIYTVNLWELAADLAQPLDFSTDINSTSNTFSFGAGDDGWDWEDGLYDTGSTCVRFNADPNDDNSAADSSVGSQNELMIQIGDYEDSCNNDGHGSGAYGVQFEVSSDMYDVINGGGTATLSFDWTFDDHSLDDGDSVWIKARFGNASGMTYLGSQDGGTNDDATAEIFYDNNPNDHSGSESIDVSTYITTAGTYYLEFGGKVLDWENNEWLEAEFDNINLVIEG